METTKRMNLELLTILSYTRLGLVWGSAQVQCCIAGEFSAVQSFYPRVLRHRVSPLIYAWRIFRTMSWRNWTVWRDIRGLIFLRIGVLISSTRWVRRLWPKLHVTLRQQTRSNLPYKYILVIDDILIVGIRDQRQINQILWSESCIISITYLGLVLGF